MSRYMKISYTLFYRDLKWIVEHGLATDIPLLTGRRYDPSVRYVFSDRGEIEVPGGVDAATQQPYPLIQEIGCDMIFDRYNADDRPNAQTAPSMSAGDIVVVGEQAYFCSAHGYSKWTMWPEVEMPHHLVFPQGIEV